MFLDGFVKRLERFRLYNINKDVSLKRQRDFLTKYLSHRNVILDEICTETWPAGGDDFRFYGSEAAIHWYKILQNVSDTSEILMDLELDDFPGKEVIEISQLSGISVRWLSSVILVESCEGFLCRSDRPVEQILAILEVSRGDEWFCIIRYPMILKDASMDRDEYTTNFIVHGNVKDADALATLALVSI